MKSKNIFIFSPLIYPCDIGGIEIFNYYFTKSLSKKYNISILTNCNITNIKDVNHIKIKQKNILFFYLSILIKILSTKNHDFLIFPYTSNSPLIYPILIVHLIYKIPYIIVIHGGGMYPWKPVFLQKFFFKKASKIIAVSKPIKDEYKKRTDNKIIFIPPLIQFYKEKLPKVELQEFYGFHENDKIITCIGSIKKIKGNEILLKAFMNLGMDFINKHNLKLLFVGDGPLKPILEKEVFNKKFNKKVIFTGTIPHNKIKEIYKITDIYIIPSQFEGTPISLLEAMFNSLPIIGSNVVGINNIIKDKYNGLLFNIEDYDDLTSKMKKLLENPNSWSMLGNKAKKTFQSYYDYDKMMNHYNKIIKEIIGENNE